MRRLVPRLRAPALLLAALALWLAPRLSHPDTPAPATPVAPAAAPAPTLSAAPHVRPAPIAAAPSGPEFTLVDNGAPRPFVVALDELYLPARPVARRLAAIPPQPDLDALLAHARSLSSAGPDASPRLVLYPAGAPRNAVTRRIVNPRIEVALASADTPSPASRPDLGIVAWDRPAYAPDIAIARIAGDAAQPLRAATAAASLPGVRSARPLLARQRFGRLSLNDPQLPNHWHLRNVRAPAAWDSATGSGVTIAIVDDGVDLTHPDLSPALNNLLGRDWNGNDSDPSAEDHWVDYEGESYLENDNHGTAVAGLAGARGGNRVGGAGAAPFATLAAFRLIAAPTDDTEEADAMTWRNEVIAIKNNSWGPYDYYPDVSPAPALWLSAVSNGASSGRDGRGVLYFWSSGNGQADGDQGALDGYASSRFVIAVGATAKSGGVAGFSEGGPHLVVSAPGSGGLPTTDRVDQPGYSSGSYTGGFNGTSASAPIASGVGALLLEARPDLGWRDVKEILLRSSSKLQGKDSDWVSRPAGDAARPVKHHPRLGGGQINALEAVTLARHWTPLGVERQLPAYPPFSFNGSTIPDNSSGGVAVPFEIFEGSSVLRVEHAVVTVNLTHPARRNLEITLTSPSGTVSKFTQANSRLTGAHFADYPFTSVRHWGEPSHFPSTPARRWTLKVRDLTPGGVGTLHSASLTLYGTELAAPQRLADLADQTLATGSTLVLRAAFSGGNLDYEWRRDGQLLRGADSAELRLPKFSAKLAGTYTCLAKNPLGSASVAATVTLDDTPRHTFDIRAGTTTSINLGDHVSADIKLWKATGLPPGLKLDPATGLLTGRPTKPGAKSVIITATSLDGAVTRLPLAFTIAPVAASLTGNYVGLVSRDPVLNADLGGALSLKVSANGAASGSLTLGKTVHPFSGLLDGTDPAASSLTITLPKPALRLALALTESDGATSLSATLVSTSAAEPAASASATLAGARSTWHAKTRPATAYVGSVAAAFEPETDTGPALGATVLTFKIAANGRATWLLTPADGAPALTGSSPLTDHGLLLAYARYATSLGSILAALPAPTTDAPALSPDAFLDWLRKPAPALAAPEGFGASIHVPRPGGGRHAQPASGVRILGLSADTPTAVAALAESTAQIDSASPLDAAITVTVKNAFTVAAPNPAKLALKFAADTGRVTGSHRVESPARTAKITAVVLPFADPAEAVGFAFAPAVANTPPRSTAFLLRPASE